MEPGTWNSDKGQKKNIVLTFIGLCYFCHTFILFTLARCFNLALGRVAKSPFVAFCSMESEKRGFRFPYKSMTYIAGH
jgi:hypothetical protein